MRYWWPHFTTGGRASRRRSRGYRPATIAFVRWIDEPGDCEAATLKAACKVFKLGMPDETAN